MALTAVLANRASAAAHKKLVELKLNLWLLRDNLEKNKLTVTTRQQSSASRRNFALSFEKSQPSFVRTINTLSRLASPTILWQQ